MNAADPMRDQLVAAWRDMSMPDRRCVALHISIMRRCMAVGSIVKTELAEHAQLGPFFVVGSPGELEELTQLHLENERAKSDWKTEAHGLVLHFANDELKIATTLADAVLGEFSRRTPADLITRLVERANREVEAADSEQ